MKHEGNIIIREAVGHFPFTFHIEKAVAVEKDGQMVIEGVASTGNVDHDKERMSPEALKAMADVVNTTGVPLRIEHSQKDNAIIGMVNEARLDERNQLWIKAVLDPSHLASPILYNALKAGGKYGLSVGGFVKRAAEEMVEGVGQKVKTFYDIALDEVSVTQHPSNYDAIGLKAIKSRQVETDYLQAFAKSIPANEWKRVEKKDYQVAETSIMETKDEEKETKAASETGDEKETKATKEDSENTEKSVSRGEFNQLAKMVSEGFNSLTKAITLLSKAGMSVEAKDEAQPSKDKKDVEGEKAVGKASSDAVDQANPDKKKEIPDGMAVKAGDRRSGEKDEGGNGDDLHGTREKAAKEGDSETYDLATVQRSIKTITTALKAMETDTEGMKTKAADEKETKETKAAKEEDSERTTKSIGDMSAIDQFTVVVADAIERMEKSLKANNFQAGHVAKMVIEQIKSNPEQQALIKDMVRQPGSKRSVIMGTPFVKTRDGRMFKLVSEEHPQSKVEKSESGKKLSFKQMWGTTGLASAQGEQ